MTASTVIPVESTTMAPVVPTEDLTFTTGDGVNLVGRRYGEGTTAIVCSHQRQSSKADFAAAGPVLAAEGFMVLAYDNRGDGESEQGLPADQGLDLLSAIELVRARGAEKVVLLGASRGGTLSLDAATQTDVDAIVTLSSPPPDDGPAAVAAVTAPSLYVNSENDRFADSTQEMFEAANQPKEIEIYPGGNHGVALFDSEPGLIDRIVAFISAQTAA
jgi:pimeloyl-ACP methyl ester carboxylesterase